MLVRNGRLVFGGTPGNFSGAFYGQAGNIVKGGLRNRVAGGFDPTFSAYPNGTLHPGTFVLPQRAGSIASYTDARSSISQNTVTLIIGRPIEATGSISLTVLNSQLDQIVPMNASGSITITVDSAQLAAAVAATASGSITLAVNTAQLGGIFELSASGSIAITPNVTLTALAFMEAQAGGPTPLSPEGLAAAVWSAALADYDAAGTTGKALADASAAGNPWSALLASNNDPDTFGERVQKLLTTGKFIALK